MKVIIPMAGVGSRFSTQGYSNPKPLIQFLGKPMIQQVVEHLGLTHLGHVFLCQKTHIQQFNLRELFETFLTDFEIVEVDGLTDGAATTVTLAKQVVDTDDEVMIVNSDQLVHWDKNIDFADAGTIFCFHGNGTKWSYAAIDDSGKVTKVAEKVQISNHATSGMYHWKKFGYFLDAYAQMVAANDRTNNEFYVAPVYNYALDKGVTIRYVDGVDQVGTPEELSEYLSTR
jgi:dTDP-glucose pyrophosphorylase